ncbi:MAG: bifunctional 5,10-methylenetetrahydrofolate dehydrogenase/5,10-methenyltetrahydrofolate cyclohydrolase, partial [Candidatus Omnitrophica bacterium]|nr:bifunctional 5,10-methylenetetrahydrofolate dehydrogenase/5,10-methenyltetrahydrofolate cyclohydrolase [Candidatus Omnitrophota bacterium]
MAGKLLEGKPIAEKMKAALAEEIKLREKEYKKVPKLVALQMGESPSSAVYVKNQKKAAEALGITYELKMLDDDMPQEEAEAAVAELNKDEGVTAMILQLPLPKQIDAKRLISAIDPAKDAEGMHPQNIGKILLGGYRIGPCTALAVMELLGSTGVDLYGKEAVVVGHSEIVGKPLALMLLNKFVT